MLSLPSLTTKSPPPALPAIILSAPSCHPLNARPVILSPPLSPRAQRRISLPPLTTKSPSLPGKSSPSNPYATAPRQPLFATNCQGKVLAVLSSRRNSTELLQHAGLLSERPFFLDVSIML